MLLLNKAKVALLRLFKGGCKMDNNYIVIEKSKVKHACFLFAIGAAVLAAIVYICACEPFLGFGIHDTAEQIFRLICGIVAPVVLMTATDYFITVVFNRKKLAGFVVLAEAILVCVRYCYISLCAFDGNFLGFTEPAAVIAIYAAFHVAFLAALVAAWFFILHRTVTKSVLIKAK